MINSVPMKDSIGTLFFRYTSPMKICNSTRFYPFYSSLLFIFAFFLAGCGSSAPSAPASTPTSSPTPPIITSPIPVSNAEGTPIANQPGFIEWVLLSGVDEHGLIAEHTLMLLKDADPQAAALAEIHTGSPVIVLEIRNVGPQGLQRFYHVQTLEDVTGWISDYYVRRQAYVFNGEDMTVPLFDKPRGAEIARLENVTPVTLRQPQDLDWWQVSTLDGNLVGWVESKFIKESPEKEFLLGNNEHEHSCENCPYLLP